MTVLFELPVVSGWLPNVGRTRVTLRVGFLLIAISRLLPVLLGLELRFFGGGRGQCEPHSGAIVAAQKRKWRRNSPRVPISLALRLAEDLKMRCGPTEEHKNSNVVIALPTYQ